MLKRFYQIEKNFSNIQNSSSSRNGLIAEFRVMRFVGGCLSSVITFHPRALVLGAIIMGACPGYAAYDFDREQIQKRIRPIGQVRVEASANEVKQSEKPKQEVSASPPSGQAVYEQYCVICHRDGIAGAPKFRSEADWKPRLSKQSMDGLVKAAIKGLNAMPPKGTCQTCSDAEIKAAVEYMVPKS